MAQKHGKRGHVPFFSRFRRPLPDGPGRLRGKAAGPFAVPGPCPASARGAGPGAAAPAADGRGRKVPGLCARLRATAVAAGITPETYNRAMAGIAPVPSIKAIIAEQPEFVRPVWAYLDGAVSARRMTQAKALLEQNAAMLAGIEAKTGVPREILVAIWGMETDYGRDVGSYNVFATLVTQAYDGPRQIYAQHELIAALRLLQQNDYTPSEMVSSWAGAIGQTQFMPSTFFKYATDGDGDGKIDLWHSPPTRWPRPRFCSSAKVGRRESLGALKCACPQGSPIRTPIWALSNPCQNGPRGG